MDQHSRVILYTNSISKDVPKTFSLSFPQRLHSTLYSTPYLSGCSLCCCRHSTKSASIKRYLFQVLTERSTGFLTENTQYIITFHFSSGTILFSTVVLQTLTEAEEHIYTNFYRSYSLQTSSYSFRLKYFR